MFISLKTNRGLAAPVQFQVKHADEILSIVVIERSEGLIVVATLGAIGSAPALNGYEEDVAPWAFSIPGLLQ